MLAAKVMASVERRERRDEFAKFAMQGLLYGKTVLYDTVGEAAAALGKTVAEFDMVDDGLRLLAIHAVKIADVMLAELDK